MDGLAEDEEVGLFIEVLMEVDLVFRVEAVEEPGSCEGNRRVPVGHAVKVIEKMPPVLKRQDFTAWAELAEFAHEDVSVENIEALFLFVLGLGLVLLLSQLLILVGEGKAILRDLFISFFDLVVFEADFLSFAFMS